jgi:protein SCO1/2
VTFRALNFLKLQLQPVIANAWLGVLLISFNASATEISLPPDTTETNARTFATKGVVEELKPHDLTVVIRHGAISNYMAAMTMPFKVKTSKELAGVHAGDEVLFQLHVSDTKSWIDQITTIGTVPLAGKAKPSNSQLAPVQVAPAKNPLLDYKFTNELGQGVSLHDFRGQALAITFFYTRCPLPDYCPRLSKNFQEASQKLESMPGGPVNWHFLSISFDPEFDSPVLLKAYGESYQYDPAHWSFLTGPPDKIAELARGSGVSYESDNGAINHNFRTLIIDATGHLQTVFPTGGNLSSQIVAEIIKAAAVTNLPLAQKKNQ